jgi:hypothetical protein
LLTCLAGFVLLPVSVWALHFGAGKFLFMVLIGLGVYLPYVAIHTTLFERLIAITKERANIGFLMYVVDSVGYTGYIMLLLLKYANPLTDSVLSVLLSTCIGFGICGALILIFCNWYFKMKLKNHGQPITEFSAGQSSPI